MNSTTKHALPLALLAALCAPTFAQNATENPAEPTPENSENPDEEIVVVVTDTRTQKPLGDSASSVSVVSAERIEAKEATNITDVLRQIPGLSFSQSGTRGKTTSIFTRGTNSNHTLVLVDGVRANSPNDGRFDFGQFPAENIERIEILRGPGSALYGSDAIGGVINIITKRGAGAPRIGGNLEWGNDSGSRQTLEYGGQNGKSRFSVSAFRQDTDGEFRNDDYKNQGFSARLDRELSKNQTLTLSTRFSDADFGVPGQRRFNPDPFQRDETRDLNAQIQWQNRVGRRTDTLKFGIFDRKLTDDDTRDPNFPPSVPSEFDEKIQSLEAQTSFRVGQNLLSLGAESRRERAEVLSASSFGNAQFSEKTRTNAVYLQNEFRSGKWALIPGIRREDNSQFGDFTSYRVAAAYEITPKTRLKSTYGTAFKAPTFSALYFPNFSNPDLRPERSRGFEIGFERELNGGSFEATYFRNQIRDLIGFSPVTFTPQNINRARTSGVEFSLDKDLGRGLRFVGAHTFLSTDSSSGELLRRPEWNTSFDLLLKREKWSADLGMVAQGQRFDSNFVDEFSPRPYGGYAKFDFTLGYDLRPGLGIYARVNNIFNREYEEVAGFPAPRRGVAVGLRTVSF